MFSVVKMMKEQGNQFDWSQIALDLLSLPCFDQEKIAKFERDFEKDGLSELRFDDLLSDGYTSLSVSGWSGVKAIVKVTGENPSIDGSGDNAVITDCEPVELGLLNSGGYIKHRVLPVRYVTVDPVTADLFPVECVLTDKVDSEVLRVEDQTGFFCSISFFDNLGSCSWLVISDTSPSPGGGGGGGGIG